MPMIAIQKAAPRAGSKPPVAARMSKAIEGRANRPRVFTIPNTATPDVAASSGTPHPRMTTHTTPRFHGPNGMLDPMPERIRYAALPRSGVKPGMSTTNC